MSKVLVTGVAGFIGSSVLGKLLENGHTVLGIDSFDETLNKSSLRKNFIAQVRDPKFTFLEGNLAKLPLDALVSDLDFVIHLAATPGLIPSWSKFDKYLENNVLVTFRLAQALFSQNRNCKVLHASTSSVYGINAIGNEDIPKAPVSPYGISKYSAEQIWHSFFPEETEVVTILRYFSVYGPRQREDMAWQKFIRRILVGEEIELTNSKGHTRSFTYIEDVATLTANLVNGSHVAGVYNIAGEEEINILDGVKLVGDILGKEVKVKNLEKRLGDQLKTRGDITRARNLLNYSPNTSFEVGIRKQIQNILDSQ
jgi:UDP-glucuronate 4-epimerase